MRKREPTEDARLPRRRFFTKLMQGLIALGLTGTTGYLLVREAREEECTLEFTCTLCGKSDRCALPAARSFREYRKVKEKHKDQQDG